MIQMEMGIIWNWTKGCSCYNLTKVGWGESTFCLFPETLIEAKFKGN